MPASEHAGSGAATVDPAAYNCLQPLVPHGRESHPYILPAIVRRERKEAWGLRAKLDIL